MSPNNNSDNDDLRRQAEERLKALKLECPPELEERTEKGGLSSVARGTKEGGQKSEVDTLRILHELQVHQIELEMQNKELQKDRTEIEAAAARYTDLYDFAPTGYFTLNSHGDILQTNLAGARLLNMERALLVGKRFAAFVAKADHPTFHGFLQLVCSADSDQTCIVELDRKDQLPVVLQVSATPFVDVEGCRLAVADITDREQAKRELRDSYEYLGRIINSIGDPVFIKDEHFNFVLANDAFCEFLGIPREELLGTTEKDVLPPNQMEHFLEVDKQVLSSGNANLCEEALTRSDGIIRTVVTKKTRYVDTHGKKFVVGVIRDITEYKRQEQEREALRGQLTQSQKLESIGTLAGGVAHEINNPIMGIMNYAQLIQDGMDEESPLQEYASEIMVETHRVATIVKNLLGFARQDKQSHRSPARMCDIVNGVLSLVGTVTKHDQVALTVDVPEDLPQIRCRSQQIQQVIMNLLTNARDALNKKYPRADKDKIVRISAQLISGIGHRMADGGTADVGDGISDIGTEQEHKQKQVNFAAPSPISNIRYRYVRITIEDHGGGIPPKVCERMFDPFFTTKPKDKGTGLGLSISHGIVKDHGGELSVESEPGQWTRFYVDLPVESGLEKAES